MWSSHAVRPLDGSPTPEQLQQWQRRMSPPENEFPAGVGLTVLLAHGDDAAVGITQIEAFSTGFRFTLAVRLRSVPAEFRDGRLFMLVGSHARPGTPLEQRLLFGLEYSDGRRASTLRGLPQPDELADNQRLLLAQQGGGGGRQGVDQTYWVSPLPPAGPVTFVVAWPGFGLPESRTAVDAGAIRTAAERSRLLWPPQPVKEPAEPQPPPRPSSGWFAEPPS